MSIKVDRDIDRNPVGEERTFDSRLEVQVLKGTYVVGLKTHKSSPPDVIRPGQRSSLRGLGLYECVSTHFSPRPQPLGRTTQ